MNIQIQFKIFPPLLLLICFTDLSYSQSLRSELKKDLWKTIMPYSSKKDVPMNPLVPAPGSLLLLPENNSGVDVMKYYYKSKMKLLLDDFYEQYIRTHTLDPHVYTYNGDESLTKVKAGYLKTEFMGGHFQQIPANGNRVGAGNFTVDLSGGGRKHVSEKTKKVLKEVYGREVEE